MMFRDQAGPGRLPKGSSVGEAVPLEVLGSSLEPGHIDEPPPDLEVLDEAEGAYQIANYVACEASEPFETAIQQYSAGRNADARRMVKSFLVLHPLHIDSYHHLGNIAWDEGHVERALKYQEMGYRIGWLTLPDDFEGRLPWRKVDNRPFLRACHGRALALKDCSRPIEAAAALPPILGLTGRPRRLPR